LAYCATEVSYAPHTGHQGALRAADAWGADHAHNLAGATPLIALDMYEHSYHMDFGAKAGAYVDALMQNLSWTAAEAAFAKLGA
jgi:Fe-Mn family superoxide dismutase